MSCSDAPATRRCCSAADPPRWGGRDRVAGGTWLAVDPAGRIGAVTNRHPGGVFAARDHAPPDARRPAARRPRRVDDRRAARGWSRWTRATTTRSTCSTPRRRAAFWTSLDDETRTPHRPARPRHPRAHRAGRRRPGRPQGRCGSSGRPRPLWPPAASRRRPGPAPPRRPALARDAETPAHRPASTASSTARCRAPPSWSRRTASATTTPRGRPARTPSHGSSDGTCGAIVPSCGTVVPWDAWSTDAA